MIPLPTTTITVYAQSPAELRSDPYGGFTNEDRVVVARNVRASIGRPTGIMFRDQGDMSELTLVLRCDIPPSDITYKNYIRDDNTGMDYEVLWATKRIGLNLDHIEAGIRQVEGQR